jgi:adenylate kinase
MNFLITGTPGCGKTTLAKNLAKELKLKVINEKDFALQNKIGSFNDENELEIPLDELKKAANNYLKENKGIIFEGHTFSEIKLNVDKVILIKIDPEELELRLLKRNYTDEKVMDNVFCEGIDYIKKKVLENYKKEKIIEINSQSSEKLTFAKTLFALSDSLE